MSVMWESQEITDQDVRFLKSLRIADKWQNDNARFREEKEQRESAYREDCHETDGRYAIFWGAVSALVLVAVLVASR